MPEYSINSRPDIQVIPSAQEQERAAKLASAFKTALARSGRKPTAKLLASQWLVTHHPGLKLFPLIPNGKKPAVKNFGPVASDDPERLTAWFASGRDCNIGVACGPSGIVVIDTDMKTVDGEANLMTLAEGDPIREAQFDPAYTFTVQTTSGGRHRYFRTDKRLSNSVGKVADGIDIRAAGSGEDGGLVVAPGSVVAGKPYTIVSDADIADAPDWLVELIEAASAPVEPRKAPEGIELDTPAAIGRARDYLLADAPLAVEGSGGDSTTYTVAAHVRDFGISEDTALELMADHWDGRCSPPWGEDLADKVANAYRYAQNEIGCDDPAAHFDILPDDAPANDNGPGGGVLDRGTLDLRALAGQPVPPRDWLVDGWIPGRNVTLLYGDGGTGKSLAAMQLAIAVAIGAPWLGLPAASGRALYLTAEDDADELHRRIADIASGHGVSFAELAGNLKAVSLAEDDPALATATDRDRLKKTPLWRELVRLIGDWRPRLVVLDTLADIFAGNENVRNQARAFIAMLRAVAIERDMAVLVLAHPSRAGLEAHGHNAAAGSSGSTAWHNSVRSRLLLARDDKTGLRTLSIVKANYGAVGTEIRLHWHEGAFIAEGGAKADAAAAKEADRVFLEMLDSYTAQNRRVGSKKGTTYAPSLFAEDDQSGMFDSKALADAMNRLFAADAIRVVEDGPPSRRRSYIVRNEPMAQAA